MVKVKVGGWYYLTSKDELSKNPFLKEPNFTIYIKERKGKRITLIYRHRITKYKFSETSIKYPIRKFWKIEELTKKQIEKVEKELMLQELAK